MKNVDVVKENTIKDVAKAAAVSIATVSRVINNPESVKPATRERVNSSIQSMNYRPNALARGLIAKETGTVGAILQDISNLFYPEVVKGIENVLARHGYGIFLCDTDGNIEKEVEYIKMLSERRVDGFIFVGTRPIEAKKNLHIKQLAEEIPVVMINDQILGSNVYSVLTDEVEGAYKAVTYLLEQGNTKIAFITSSAPFTTYRYKEEGYRLALRDNNIEVQEQWIQRDVPDAAGGARAMGRMLFDPEGITAAFVASDQMALGVIKAILQKGFKIPEDYSVIGFGGSDFTESMYPPLTTVSQFPYKTGEAAAKMLFQLMTKEEELPQRKLTLQPELIIRDSCKRFI